MLVVPAPVDTDLGVLDGIALVVNDLAGDVDRFPAAWLALLGHGCRYCETRDGRDHKRNSARPSQARQPDRFNHLRLLQAMTDTPGGSFKKPAGHSRVSFYPQMAGVEK